MEPERQDIDPGSRTQARFSPGTGRWNSSNTQVSPRYGELLDRRSIRQTPPVRLIFSRAGEDEAWTRSPLASNREDSGAVADKLDKHQASLADYGTPEIHETDIDNAR